MRGRPNSQESEGGSESAGEDPPAPPFIGFVVADLRPPPWSNARARVRLPGPGPPVLSRSPMLTEGRVLGVSCAAFSRRGRA
jgi:hypothetical protein